MTVPKLDARIPFLHNLGAELIECGKGRAVLTLEVQPHHHNSKAVAHGGVLMTLLDAALAIAGRSAHNDDFNAPGGAVTVEMKTSFLMPATGHLTIEGRCVHKAITLLFCEGEVRDASNRVVARASGTFKYVVPRPAQPHPSGLDA